MPGSRLFTVLGLLGASVACSSTSARDVRAASPSLEAAVVPARIEAVADSFDVGGVVRARTTATIMSRIIGEVREVRVAPGDRVRRSQVLITLDSRELSANEQRAESGRMAAEHAAQMAAADRQAADANLALATATHNRVAELRARNSATPQELDQAVAGLKGAQARVEMAEAGIAQAGAALDSAVAAAQAARVGVSYAALTAPFDGIVTEKLVEPGNTAAPGMPLMTIEELGGYRLEVRMDESQAARLSVGARARVRLDAAPDALAAGEMDGTVAEIARTLDPGGHTFLVKVDLPGAANLRSGMFGRAAFAGPSRRALVIPATALLRRGQLRLAFVVDGDRRARLRLIDVSEPLGDLVEVRAGIDENEQVIVSPSPALVDGAVIRPLWAARPPAGTTDGHQTGNRSRGQAGVRG